jgi:hypothetical protein
MRSRSVRLRTTLAALAVTALAATAAGAAAPAAANPGTARNTTEALITRAGAEKAGTGVNRMAAAAPECLDPVVYTVNASTVRKTLPTVCIAVGGVLRIASLGPEGLTAVSPTAKADCSYGGGVHACRLIGTGTVQFSITNAQGTRRQTVVVSATATRPRLPDACLGAEIVTRDANEGGMPWSAICMHLNVPLRFTNLGSAIFNVNPADSVNCWDGDDGLYCMPSRTGTVRFTITRPGVADLIQTVVFVE